MNKTKFSLLQLPLGLAIAWVVILPLRIQAQTISLQVFADQRQSETIASRRRRLLFPSPPPPQAFEDQGRPITRIDGGNRGSIFDGQLVALVPGYGSISESKECRECSNSLLATTTDASPSFWFYIPPSEQTEFLAEFVLLDDEHKAITVQTMTISETGAIVEVKLDESLEPDREYHWLFSLEINPQSPSQNPMVEGLVKLIIPDASLTNQLEASKSERHKVDVYVQEDVAIWHDALTTLAKLRRHAPEDEGLRQDWMDFLDSVGLEEISNAPISDCCTLISETLF